MNRPPQTMQDGCGTRRRDTVRALLCCAALALGSYLVRTTAAQAATPPSLAYEILESQSPNVETSLTENCDAQGNSTVTFTAQGQATGPYPGTFTASGSFTLGAQTLPGGSNTNYLPVGPVLSFHEDFQIESSSGDVRGSKDLATPPAGFQNSGGPINTGACTDFADITLSQITHASGTVAQASPYSKYSATITTPDGAFQQTGGAFGIINDQQVTSSSRGAFRAGEFAEIFYPGSPVSSPGPAAVTLSPPDATNPVGTDHTVTASVSNESGDPMSGQTVAFKTQGSVNTTGSCTTDTTGQCSFTYTGPNLPGADMVIACADTNGNGLIDPGETICGSATKAWVLPTATAGQSTGGGQVWNGAHSDQVAFGFNAKSDQNGVKGECTVVDPSTSTKIKCLDATTMVQTATHATIFGDATVNGAPTTYRIDVYDNAEPGAGSDTFKIQTDSGYTVGGTLTHGNIQVH